jgi:hypothetical protein
VTGLMQYAATRKRYTRCKICLLPTDVRDELEESKRVNSRVTFKTMRDWLNEERSDVLRDATGLTELSKDQVYRHWSSGHHEADVVGGR